MIIKDDDGGSGVALLENMKATMMPSASGTDTAGCGGDSDNKEEEEDRC